MSLGLAAADQDVIVDDLDEGLKEMDKADKAYRKAQLYYEGTFPEVFASARLRAALARTGMDFRLNFAKTPVDAVVSRLKINAITSPLADVQERITQIWDDNQLDLFEILSFRRACEFGDSYLLVWPDDTIKSGVRVYLNNPRVMRLLYDSENEIEKRFAIKRWTDGNTKRATLYYADRIEKYVTKPGETGRTRDDWTRHQDPGDAGWPLDNEFGEVPVFHLRTDFQYGVPEHLNAYGAQNLIHKLAMGHAAGADYHALPQRYALLAEGTTSNDFSVGDEDTYSYSLDTGATSQADDARAQLRSEPGSMWFMEGVQAMGEFGAADPSVFIAPMTFYVKAMAQITTTPAHYFDTIGQTPSGESLRTMEAPFVEKCENRQLLFGGAWRDALDFAIYVAMQIQDPQISVHWNPCSSVSDMQTWQTADIKNRLGVPAKQLLLEAGYNEEQVEEWLEEGAQTLAQQIETLNAIGVAAQGLAVAVQLGVIDEADVRVLLTQMLELAPAGRASLGAAGARELPEGDDDGTISQADEPGDVETAGDGGGQ